MAQALQRGEFPHLHKLQIDDSYLDRDSLQSLASEFEEGCLHRLVTFTLVAWESENDGLVLMMRVFGRAPQHTQSLRTVRIALCHMWYWLEATAIDTLTWSLQQQGAFPRLTSLRLAGQDDDAPSTQAALTKCKEEVDKRGGRFDRKKVCVCLMF